MNATQVHLVLTHYPSVIPTIALPILWIGIWKKNDLVLRLALGLVILTALMTYISYESGVGAKNLVRSLPEVDRALLYGHWERAENALWFQSALGVFGAILLFFQFKARKIHFSLWVAFSLGILFCTYLIFIAAHSGGAIRHSELSIG